MIEVSKDTLVTISCYVLEIAIDIHEKNQAMSYDINSKILRHYYVVT